MLRVPLVLPSGRRARRRSICPCARALCHEAQSCGRAAPVWYHRISEQIKLDEELFPMSNAVAIAALALTLCVTACSGPKQSEFTREDGEAIRANATSFTAAFNQKHTDKLVEMYADNSVFMPPNAP